jgi:uncharacterized membrane protein
MAVDVRTDVEINRSRDAVARFASDPDNAPRWYANIKAVEWRTPPPLRVGSRLAFIAQFLGRQLVYTYEVVELSPDRRLVMRTAEGPFPMETTYEFDPVSEDQTHMRLRNRGEPSGFGKLLAPFVALAMRRENRKDLARLKSILERGG